MKTSPTLTRAPRPISPLRPISPISPIRPVSPPLHVSPTRDLDYLDQVLRHPDVYGPACDDTSPSRETITVAHHLADSQNIFLRVSGTDCQPVEGFPRRSPRPTDLGFFSFHPLGHGYIVHTCLLPNCRGALAIAAGKLAAAWMFTHTPATSLVSHCWENRPHVLLFAKRVGFEPRTKTLWPARVGGVQIFSTSVCLTRAMWKRSENLKAEG
jgi:hypothetical protein